MKFKNMISMLSVILSIIVLSFISLIVHEFGHYLTAYFFGITATIEIHLFSNSSTRINRLPDNVNIYRLFLINGSLFACFFGLALILIDYKIKTDFLVSSGYSIIIGNCVYWMRVSDEVSDAYLFIATFNSYNYVLHFTIIFFILILITFLFIIYNYEKTD